MEVILFQPEIPQNTGNIVRTCAITGTHLSLVRPLGFSLSKRQLRRAGLDYWDYIEPTCVDSLEEKCIQGLPFYFFSSKATTPYTEISFTQNSLLIFGNETSGLPALFFERWPHLFYTIPMKPGLNRCLNLSNAVSIVLYEAWRQLRFSFSYTQMS